MEKGKGKMGNRSRARASRLILRRSAGFGSAGSPPADGQESLFRRPFIARALATRKRTRADTIFNFPFSIFYEKRLRARNQALAGRSARRRMNQGNQ